MKWRALAATVLCLGLLGRCVCAPEPAPGQEGDTCDDEAPCADGLSCIDGTCVGTTVDAGRSDATIGDAPGDDGARMDASAVDLVLPDVVDGDTLVTDRGSRPDSVGRDGGGAGDRGNRPDGAGRPDSGPSDRGSRPDGLSVPDIAGWDLAWLADRQLFNDAGLAIDVIGFDAGIGSYTGIAEPGVVCGSVTCSQIESCYPCISMAPALSCSPDELCDGFKRTLACDGAEDCSGGEECCATASYDTYCATAGACYSDNASNILICVDSGDCRGGFVCCASTIFANLGLDIGWCQSWCN